MFEDLVIQEEEEKELEEQESGRFTFKLFASVLQLSLYR